MLSNLAYKLALFPISQQYTVEETWNWKLLGGYSAGVPPLPIPNREVKPNYADGTAHNVGE